MSSTSTSPVPQGLKRTAAAAGPGAPRARAGAAGRRARARRSAISGGRDTHRRSRRADRRRTRPTRCSRTNRSGSVTWRNPARGHHRLRLHPEREHLTRPRLGALVAGAQGAARADVPPPGQRRRHRSQVAGSDAKAARGERGCSSGRSPDAYRDSVESGGPRSAARGRPGACRGHHPDRIGAGRRAPRSPTRRSWRSPRAPRDDSDARSGCATSTPAPGRHPRSRERAGREALGNPQPPGSTPGGLFHDHRAGEHPVPVA